MLFEWFSLRNLERVSDDGNNNMISVLLYFQSLKTYFFLLSWAVLSICWTHVSHSTLWKYMKISKYIYDHSFGFWLSIHFMWSKSKFMSIVKTEISECEYFQESDVIDVLNRWKHELWSQMKKSGSFELIQLGGGEEFSSKLTWPKSMVRLTSLYFIPRESGGLCHQFDVPSIAYSAGWERSGRFGSQ